MRKRIARRRIMKKQIGRRQGATGRRMALLGIAFFALCLTLSACGRTGGRDASNVPAQELGELHIEQPTATAVPMTGADELPGEDARMGDQTQGSATDETTSNGTATDETATDETASNETATDETATDETASNETASNETATDGREIDPEGKMIALTFDDGPGAGTRRILRALDEVDGRATFCMVGNRLGDYAQTAREVAEQGSEIATHTWDHPNLTKLSAERVRRELCDSLDAIEETTGVRPSVLRPPYGSVNAQVKQACAELGLTIANWNIDPEDWKTRDAADIRSHILSHAKDGAIVVCHDLYAETATAMESAIRELSQRGYQLVTVTELLNARAGGGEAGKVYYAA